MGHGGMCDTAPGVLAPSQGRGERCLWVRLDPHCQAVLGPGSLAEVNSHVLGTFQRVTPGRFTRTETWTLA